MIAEVGKHLRQAVSKVKRSDFIPLERCYLPYEMGPGMILQKKRFIAAFVVLVRKNMRAFIMERERGSKRRCTGDICKDPQRNAVIFAPVLGMKRARRDQILPFSAAVYVGDVYGRTGFSGSSGRLSCKRRKERYLLPP